jgi:hypothetical protein
MRRTSEDRDPAQTLPESDQFVRLCRRFRLKLARESHTLGQFFVKDSNASVALEQHPHASFRPSTCSKPRPVATQTCDKTEPQLNRTHGK